MSEKIRNRRTVIAAGVLSLALVAPATNVPVIQDLALPVAYAATDKSTIEKERYETENFWQKREAKITGLTLDAGDEVESTRSTIFNWTFRNDNGELVLIRPESGAAFKSGNVDIDVKVTPADGAPFTATLKLTVVDKEDKSWQNALPDFASRRAVDFSNDLVQDISDLKVPQDVEIGMDGITPLGWNVANNNGVLQVQAPRTFAGSAPVNVDIPIKLTYNGSEKKATLLLKATPPKKSAAGGTAGTVGGALLPILGGIIGLIPGAGPLGNALGSLGNLLGGLGGGNNGGTGGNNGGTGGNTGGTGGNTGGRGGIFDGMFRDAVKIEVKDNGSHNGSNNTGIAPSAVAPSAVVVSDNASNNGSNNTGVAPSAVVVSDNTGVAPSAVVVTDNASNNGSNNTGVAPSAVNVSDNGSNNTGVAPSAVNVSDNGSNNTGVAPSAVNVSGNGSNNTGVAPSAVIVSDNASNNGNNNTGVAPSAVIVTDNGSNNASNNTGIDKRRGEGKAPAADGKSKISDPKCIASLVGFGLPAAVLIPVLLANVFRIPGFEGIQDSMKAAAASIGAPLNIPKEQVAAGVGGFAGAFAIAGLIGTITQCVPSKAEKEAAESSESSTTETAAPTTTESTTPAPKPSGSSKKAPKTTEPTPATK